MVEIEVEIGFKKGLSMKEKEKIAEEMKKLIEIFGMKVDNMEWTDGRE